MQSHHSFLPWRQARSAKGGGQANILWPKSALGLLCPPPPNPHLSQCQTFYADTVISLDEENVGLRALLLSLGGVTAELVNSMAVESLQRCKLEVREEKDTKAWGPRSFDTWLLSSLRVLYKKLSSWSMRQEVAGLAPAKGGQTLQQGDPLGPSNELLPCKSVIPS